MDSNEIRRLIVNMIRKGSVSDVDLSTDPPMVRVSVGDPDDADNPGLATNWIPFLGARAGKTREWNPLTTGEQVVLFCPMGDPAQGVALGGLYSDSAPAPSKSADKHLRVYPDDAAIEYDHAAHVLNVDLPAGATVNVTAPGTVNVTTQTALVTADKITLDGDTTVTKSLTVQGRFAFQSGMSGKSGAAGGKTMQIDGEADFTGEVTSQGKSLPHHSHKDQGDGNLVSEPV